MPKDFKLLLGRFWKGFTLRIQNTTPGKWCNAQHYKSFEHYAHFEQHWQMEVTLEIRLLPRHYSNDLSYMPEGSNRWRKRPLPSSANNRRMHRCAGSKNGGWGQSLSNKVLLIGSNLTWSKNYSSNFIFYMNYCYFYFRWLENLYMRCQLLKN